VLQNLGNLPLASGRFIQHPPHHSSPSATLSQHRCRRIILTGDQRRLQTITSFFTLAFFITALMPFSMAAMEL
jgi:hypothetical protein